MIVSARRCSKAVEGSGRGAGWLGLTLSRYIASRRVVAAATDEMRQFHVNRDPACYVLLDLNICKVFLLSYDTAASRFA